MTLHLRALMPWLMFVLCIAAALVFGNHAVQKATMRDYDAEYIEYHLSYLEKEVARLRAHNHELQQELADGQADD